MARAPNRAVGTKQHDVWTDYAGDQIEDRRIRRWSVGIGLSLHLVGALVLSVGLPPPTIGYELPEKPEHVVRPIR